MIEIGINSEILKQIIDGRKTIEGRLAKGKFLDIAIGNTVKLREDIHINGVISESKESTVKIEVTNVKKFGSFREMLTAEGFESVIPSAASIDQACSEYALYYSSEDEDRYGVPGIHFECIISL